MTPSKSERLQLSRHPSPIPITALVVALILFSADAVAQNRNGSQAGVFLSPNRDAISGFVQQPRLSLFSSWTGRELFAPAGALEVNSYQEVKPKSPTFKITVVPASLITLGLLTFSDEGFLDRRVIRDIDSKLFPTFEDYFDNFAPFVPAVMVLGLNVGGVKGRHTLGRASLSYTVGAAITYFAVRAGKRLTAVVRPNGRARTSFPSGHSASAFLSATFLHKEYGPKNILYSVAGYTMATLVGIRVADVEGETRVFNKLNNRHWVSDVLVGAGVGIVSTQVAYILVDRWAKGGGVNTPPTVSDADRPRGNPSFLNFKVGYARQVGDFSVGYDALRAKGGHSSGAEGAYFFNKNLGFGGEFTVAAFPINSDNFVPADDGILLVAEELFTQPMGVQSLFAGPFFNVPLSKNVAVMAKLTGGWSSGAIGLIGIDLKEEYQEAFGLSFPQRTEAGTPVATELPIIQFDPKDVLGWAGGLALRGTLGRNVGLSLFVEYNFSRPDVEISEVVEVNEDGSLQKGAPATVANWRSDYVSFGASLSAMLW